MKYYYIEPEYYQNANIYKHYDVKERLSEALKRKNNFKVAECYL